ncbi:Fur family transcriptional regulator [Caulobacter radicis]|uniref:transcriptional repressor n=1 Tax=Caulobacter radicis TaxID=2172650 RepID=UPI000D57B846|nr:transcriptional repressor [Caulobacter radicis]PVM92389.1 Fur family transcriptional regulator [Caulobacter radicis]
MPHAVDAVLQDELRRAGLPCRGPTSRLLALLRASEETHLTAPEIAELAAEAGLAMPPAEIARQVEAFADHGLLGRLPTTTAEPVFDTQPEPHFHLIYEDTARIVDLHVSPETLLAMLRDALARRPGGVEVVVVMRRENGPATGG